MLSSVIRAQSANGESCDWQAVDSKCIWVDVQTPTTEELVALKSHFKMNPLALEDALEHGHWSRYEQYPEHEFITFRTLVHPNEDSDYTERISLFMYPHILLTISHKGTSYLPEVHEMVGRESVNTSLEVAYELLDSGSQNFFVYISSFEDGLDRAEEEIFAGKHKQDAQLVFERRHRLSQVRAIAAEALAAVTAMNRHMSMAPADQIRFRDVQDTLNRAVVRLDSLRDGLRSLLDLQLNLQNQRMNEVMKTLTAVSTIFLPLTFLAGVWGMNFQYMPELHWHYGYAMAWTSFLLIAGLLIAYFYRRRWW